MRLTNYVRPVDEKNDRIFFQMNFSATSNLRWWWRFS